MSTECSDYLIVSGPLLDTEGERYIDDLSVSVCDGRLVVSAEDCDGYEWESGRPLEHIITDMSNESCERLFILLKERLDK